MTPDDAGPPTREDPAAGTPADKARRGRDALFPFTPGGDFGTHTFGADRLGPLGHPTLDAVHLAPPLFTPHRLERLTELGREPVHTDVDTRCMIGGFVAALPVTVAALGSTTAANRHSVAVARAAGRFGAILAIGENMATMRGYAQRVKEDEPCLKERILAYLEALPEEDDTGPIGGLLIQQSVSDADAELWNRVYSDPDLASYFDAGLIGFEIKAGQGAKPGLGGEVRVTRDDALRLADRYRFPEDPRTTSHDHYDRHTPPGTYTADILAAQLRLLKNNYPKAKVWVKVAGYRDLAAVLRVCAESGADNVTVDGHAGGTGMAPTLALKHLGLPTITCLGTVAAERRRGTTMGMLVAGGLHDGADATKAVCAGASGIALGRAFLEAAEHAGEEGVHRFLGVLREEVRLLASALGKYHMEDLGPEDLVATDPRVAGCLGIADAFAPPGAGATDARPAIRPPHAHKA